MKTVIGTNKGVYYSQKRLILLKHEKFNIVRKWDLYRLIAGIERRVLKTYKLTTKLHSSFGFFNPAAYHFFNAVSNTKKPWVTTMESQFGNFKTKNFDPFDYLVRDQCKYILPYSHWAKKLQLSQIQDDDIRRILEKKMKVINVPQDSFVKTSKIIEKDTVLNFIIVGNEFFRKGGYEVLRIFERLEKEGYKFHLTIISNLNKISYPIIVSDEKFDYSINQIDTKEYISHFSNMDNNDVLNKIKEAHVGLLLSNLENYGYFLLECHAYGVPVISTKQRAFLEINNDKIGWMVFVKMNKLDIIELDSKEKRDEISDMIFKNSYQIIKGILKNPKMVKEKGDLAISNLLKNHSLEDYKSQIASIYHEIT
jgi:glycosyltransferase involved in cell wall biosynthesis